MNNMLKIISTALVVLTLLSGCTSQSSQTSSQDFDQLKAAKTRVSLGLTYLKNGNFSQAKYNLDKALEFAPRSADANFAMAYYYQSVSELEQAEKAYQFAMDLEPNNANIANSYGAFLCQNGDYEKAKTYFLKAVNTSSYVSSAETYENLAMCSQNQGRPEDSIQYLRSAVNHQPGRASSLYLLADSLVKTQQWQEAREILRRYEKVSNISPQSLLLAMKIESGTGNAVTAKGYLDMLLRIFPNDPITQAAYAEQKQTAAMRKKSEDLAVLVKKAKVVPEVVEPQETQISGERGVVETEKNALLGGVKKAKVLLVDAPKDNVAVAENEQKQSLELVQKSETPTDLIAETKVESELVASQATQLPSDHREIETENNDSLESERATNTVEEEILNDSVAKVNSEPRQNLELVEKTEPPGELNEENNVVVESVESLATQLPAENSVIEEENKDSIERIIEANGNDESLVNVNEVNNVDENVINETAAAVVEELPAQVYEVESEILEKPTFHVVVKGDNLYRISLLYNIKMQRLIDWNGLADKPAIYIGMKLSLVAPSVVE
jgi:type IV pilus assembly protein PilF